MLEVVHDYKALQCFLSILNDTVDDGPSSPRILIELIDEAIHLCLESLRIVTFACCVKVDKCCTRRVDQEIVLVRVSVQEAQFVQIGQSLRARCVIGYLSVASMFNLFNEESDHPALFTDVAKEFRSNASTFNPLTRVICGSQKVIITAGIGPAVWLNHMYSTTYVDSQTSKRSGQSACSSAVSRRPLVAP